MEAKLDALDNAMQDQTSKMENHEYTDNLIWESLGRLDGKLSVLEEQNPTSAVLDIKNKAFATIKANIGTLFISVDNVESYMDGSRVTFLIGNPFHCDITSTTLNIIWNTNRPEYESGKANEYWKSLAQWNKDAISKNFNSIEVVRSGAWNKMTCVLDKLSPQKLGYLKVGMDCSQISLKKFNQ